MKILCYFQHTDNENTMLKARAAFARSVSVERMIRLGSRRNIQSTEECPIVQDIGCACHALNTVIKSFLDGENEEIEDEMGTVTTVNQVADVVKKVKTISRAFRFGKHQEFLKRKVGKVFPQVAWTRWKTAKLVMDFLVEHRAKMLEIYRDPRFVSYKNVLVEHYLGDDHVFVVLGEILRVVSFLVKYITFFECDTLLMSHLQPRWFAIEQFFEDARDDFVWVSTSLMERTREKLDSVYDTISCDASSVAVLLDPRWRSFRLRRGDLIQAKKWLKKLLGASYHEVYSQIEQFREGRYPFDGDELNEGVSDADLIEIWRDYSQIHGLRRIAKLALFVLTMPMSNCPVERVFSMLKRVMPKSRTSLRKPLLRMLFMSYVNLRALEKSSGDAEMVAEFVALDFADEDDCDDSVMC